MVSFQPAPVLAVALAVWLVWRTVLWRGRGADPVRELLATALLLWALATVAVTFFPLRIVFYDWGGRFSLVPFASIVQLLSETSPQVALRNIAGNVVMFVPLGLLLPLLFDRARSAGAFALRAVAVSVAIEAVQFVTRARAVDVDDVLLNVTGAMLGWTVWLAVDRAARRWAATRRVAERCDRARERGGREPLTAGLAPIGVTAALVVPWMVATVLGATVGDGADGIDRLAGEGWPDADVVARTDVGGDTFVVVSDRAAREQLRLASFNRVLPGRYSLEGVGDMPPADGSGYRYGVTPFNTVRGEWPTLYLWGANRAGATTLHVRGNGLDTQLPLPVGHHFVVGVEFEPDLSAVLEEFEVRFLAADGADVTAEVPFREY